MKKKEAVTIKELKETPELNVRAYKRLQQINEGSNKELHRAVKKLAESSSDAVNSLQERMENY